MSETQQTNLFGDLNQPVEDQSLLAADAAPTEAGDHGSAGADSLRPPAATGATAVDFSTIAPGKVDPDPTPATSGNSGLPSANDGGAVLWQDSAYEIDLFAPIANGAAVDSDGPSARPAAFAGGGPKVAFDGAHIFTGQGSGPTGTKEAGFAVGPYGVDAQAKLMGNAAVDAPIGIDGTGAAHAGLAGNHLSSWSPTNSSDSGAVDGADGSVNKGGASVTIANGATAEINGPSAQSVTFAGSSGTLILNDAPAFAGQISGLAGSDAIDLTDISYGADMQVTFLGNATGGSLTITNGTSTANIALVGDYLSSTWTLSSDGSGGTIVVDPIASTNWQTLKVGAGGFVRNFDVAPDGTVIGRTDTNGAYIWNAAASSWVQLVTATSLPAAFVAANPDSAMGTGVLEIQIADSNTQILYMLFDGYMFKSANQGTTWTQLTSFNGGAQVSGSANDSYGQWGQKMAIDPNNPNIVYVGTEANGMFVTTNGGTTWSRVSGIPVGSDAGITGILFDPAIGGVVGGVTQTIFASSSGNGVYESTNGGSTWTLLANGGGPSTVQNAIVTAAGIYYATDGNNLWEYTSGKWTELLTNGNYTSVAVNPNNANEIVAIANSGQINISYNGGTTWTGLENVQAVATDIPWEQAANAWFDVSNVAFNPLVPNQVIISGGTGMWYANIPSSAAAYTSTIDYYDNSVGIENLVANAIIAPLGGTPVLASWDRSFFDITNLNSYPTSYGPGPEGSTLSEGWSIDYASSNPNFIVGISDGVGSPGPERSGYSTNGGQTWTQFALEPTDINLAASAVSTETSTTTEVLHFASLPSALRVGMSVTDTTNSNAIAWYDYATVTSISGNNVTISYTASGETITNAVSSGDTINFTEGDGGTIAASTPENIIWAPADGTQPLYTLNGGQTWNVVNLPGVTNWSGFDYAYYFNTRTVTADRVLANTFYMYEGGDIFATTNGGVSWTEPYSGSALLPWYALNSSLQSVPGEAGNLFLSSGLDSNQNDSALPFLHSTNGGQTWTAIPNVNEVAAFGYGMAAPGQTNPVLYIAGWVNGVYGVWQSNNASNPSVTNPTWVNLGTQPQGELDQITTISGDMNVYGQIYVGYGGGGYSTLVAPPSVVSVTATGTGVTNDTGTITNGTVVAFTVNLTANVTVAGGTPTLTLNNGGTATYVSGSGTNALVFTYTVGSGQSTSGLAITSVNLPSGATVQDDVATGAVLTGADVTFSGLVVATTTPAVSSLAVSPATGDLDAGNTVTLTLDFSEAVTVKGGTPTLTLNDGGTATYASGSGTGALVFSYTVASGQNASALAATAVALNGATIADGAGNAASLSLTGLTQSGPRIDTTTPAVTSLAVSPATGDLDAGNTVTLTLDFSEAVTVKGGTPTLTLNDGGTATYASGSGTGALVFSYTVASGQNASALAATAVALNGATIADGAGNAASLSLTGLTQSGPQIDTTTPAAPVITSDTVSGDTVTLSGTAQAGSTITVYDGKTDLGTTTTNSSGAWTYTTRALSLGAQTFTATAADAAGNVSAASTALDPTISAPAVTSLAVSPATGDLDAGNTVTLTLDFSEAVTVKGGTPTLTLNDGGTATYASGSGTGALVFSYTVASGQNASALAATAVALNGATIADGAGNAASLSLTGLTQAGPQVDTEAPKVSRIAFVDTSPNSRLVTITFSEAVVNFGPNDVQLGTKTQGTAGTVTGSGTTWTVQVSNLHLGTDGDYWFRVLSSGAGGADWTDVAGNPGIGTTWRNIMPAGVAGEPVDLALTAPSADHVGAVALVITGVPAGWSLSEGTDDGNGTWTVQTNDIAALSITSPDNSTGALVLNVKESWTNADGSTSNAIVSDNVETYAKGGPIFAWSGDDHLTGSNGDDLFVFANSIGNDTIRCFDAANDKIDLIGYGGFKNFADVHAHLANDAAGNAVITLGAGRSITLYGVDAGSLTANDFVFDQAPVTDNTGDMVISDGALLPLSGVVNNTGGIALASTGDETDLEILSNGAVFQGAGRITLSDSSQNVIYGATASSMLTNVNNTITGAGDIGDGDLTLVNEGTIDANGTNGLIIDTGSIIVVNSGVLEATAGGGLTVDGAVANSGSLLAAGGNLTLRGDVTGGGSATIAGSATLEYRAASTENTSFAAGASGTLKLDQSASFAGSISGYGVGDSLDLVDIGFGGNTTLGYSENSADTGGTLTVSDGAHTAALKLLGQYAAAGFNISGDYAGGTIVTYSEPVLGWTSPLSLTKPNSVIRA